MALDAHPVAAAPEAEAAPAATTPELKRLQVVAPFAQRSAAMLVDSYSKLKSKYVPDSYASYVVYAEQKGTLAAEAVSALARPLLEKYATPELIASVDERMDVYLTKAESIYSARVKPAVDVNVQRLHELKEAYLVAIERAAKEVHNVYSDKVMPQLEVLREAIAAARAKGVREVALDVQVQALAAVSAAWSAVIKSPQVAAMIAASRPVLLTAACQYNVAAAALNANETFTKAIAMVPRVEKMPLIPTAALEQAEEDERGAEAAADAAEAAADEASKAADMVAA